MRILWIVLGGGAGLVLGAVLGFGLALAVAAFGPPRNDGTFGMREMLVGLPSGALLGTIAGVAWGLRT